MPELTQALINAAQSAAKAAQAAQAASSSSGVEGSNNGVLKKDLAKLIPRPGSFSPSDREQEVLQWRDWYWSLKQYLVVVDGSFQEEIERIEGNASNEVEWDLMSKAEQERSRFLYSLSGSLVQGRLIGVVKNVESFNGYEALRQMSSNCQPQARNRTMNLLQGIMAYPSFNMKGSLLPQILKLEEHFLQYERLRGSKLSSDMKSAALLRAVTGQMKVHLNLTLNEGSSYARIREAVLAFDTATTKWNESAALSFNSSPMQPASEQGGPMPVEIAASVSGQQTTSLSTTATSTTAGTDANKITRRVSQPLFFDLREESDGEGGSIRTLKEQDNAFMSVDFSAWTLTRTRMH